MTGWLDDLPNIEGIADLSPEQQELLALLLDEQGVAPGAQGEERRIKAHARPDGRAPLSFAQQRLWFLDQLTPNSPMYNVASAIRLRGKLSLLALRAALQTVVDRHEILRTHFESEGERAVQVIEPSVVVSLPLIDLSYVPASAVEAEIRRLASDEASQPFDLPCAPLLRARLLKLDAEEHVLLVTMHHIVSDGWSMGVLTAEVVELYHAYLANRPSPLPHLEIQYADFAEWQREHLQGVELERQVDYWRRALEGCSAALNLPTDFARPPIRTSNGSSVTGQLSQELLEQLRRVARTQDATLFMVLLAAVKVLLYRYTAQTDLVVGSPIANRTRSELEPLIGFFANTLVLRTELTGEPTFSELVARVRKVTLAAYDHQDIPFEMLVEALHPERDLSRTPLFEVMFVLQNAQRAAKNLPELSAEFLDIPATTAKFDLTFNISEQESGLWVAIEYNTDLFAEPTIKRMLEHLGVLLRSAATDAEQRVSALPLMTEAESSYLLNEWNATQAEYPSGLAAHQLIEAQARANPRALAVVALALDGPDATLTYAELDTRANQLARHLRSLGVGLDTRVAISLERSLNLPVAMLAVLKAGGCYVPLDPAYPRERLAYMLEDCGANVLLTQAHLVERLATPRGPAVTLQLDTHWDAIAAESTERLENLARTMSLAYVIYTSGSTGRPKGTLIHHQGLVNYLTWCSRAYPLDQGVGAPVHSSISFDLTVTSLLAPLSNGQTVHLLPEGLAVELLTETLRKRGDFSLIKITPAHLQIIGQQLSPGEAAGRTHSFIIGGENLLADHVAFWHANASETRLFNEYGPTETVVGCCVYEAPAAARLSGSIPIGRPIINTRLYVLDRQQRLVPVGVPGELYIGGAGVARGYHKQPDLTAERFLPDPFHGLGERMYRTGDAVRLRSDGNLEYLGRLDEQIKIRGFRVELGEIEGVLTEHKAIQEATVIARNANGDTRLDAFIVFKPGRSATASALRAHLAEQLPEYMAPASYTVLPALPLTPNGKVDRKSLARQVGEVLDPNVGRANAYVAPASPTQEILAGIWGTLLHVDRIGATDNFFELGGHSLSATQMVSRVRDAFHIELPLRRLFETQTLGGLAAAIDRIRQESAHSVAPPIAPVVRDPGSDGRVRLPLSFAQQRLWFLDQLEPGGTVYNIPSAIRLTGALDYGALCRVLDALAARHEAFRTTFETLGGKPVQVIAPASLTSAGMGLAIIDVSEPDPARRETAVMALAVAEASKPFDLADGPLVRVKLLRLAADDHVLLLTMHHIISDGWSTGVVIREFGRLYGGCAGREPEVALPPLPPLAVQYADYATWQRGWLEGLGEDGSPLERQLKYWREQLARAPALLELPTDRPRPAVASHRGATVAFDLPRDLAESVRRLSREEGATSFMTLMAAFQALLSRLSGQDDVVVGTPVANRTRGELEGIVGFFVNTLAIRAKPGERQSFRELLRQVRASALGAYAHQDVPFEKLVDGLDVARNMSHSPIFQTMFVWQEPQQSGASSGLHLPGLTLTPIPLHGGTTPFDLTLVLAQEAAGLGGWLEYATDLFDRTTAEGFVGYFQSLLAGFLAAPDELIESVEILSAEERGIVLQTWNATERDLPEVCLHEAFAQQAARTPHVPALLFLGDGDQQDRREMTYAALDVAADRLARTLIGHGVKREEIVAISVEKSIEQVVGMLAVLKAGAAYLPIDPSHPAERVDYMLADARVTVLLTQSHLAERFHSPPLRQIICLDALHSAMPVNPSEEAPGSQGAAQSADTLAYVIYTSGSTGRPKGVMVPHRGVVNFVGEYLRRFELGPSQRVLQFISFSFDASVGEMFGALLSGATLVLAPRDILTDSESLLQLFIEERIDLASAPVAMLAALPRATEGYPRNLVSGGDACPPDLAARWAPGRRFFNGYGPTEVSVGPTLHEVTDLEAERYTVSIGRPIANIQAYVLDAHMQPVPPGVTGELYLGGVGVTRGYLGRPDLTAERYVPNPFSKGAHSSRLYRTGDRARWRRNGELECLGRMDDQVKVRGHRIELGEIESVLLTHPDVAQCAVLARDDAGTGAKRLVAYFTSHTEQQPSVTDLRQALRAHLLAVLPDYMVPAVFVRLDALPLTANGKVDRKALPAPAEAERAKSDRDYLAPATAAEETLARIWSEVLGVGRVGVNDNFFELGGDSILSIQVMARANQAGLQLTPKQLFQSPTIAALAAIAGAATTAAAEQGPVMGEIALTPVQRYFFDLDLPERDHWNQSVLLSARDELNPQHLQTAVAALTTHHDALRLRFTEGETGWRGAIPPLEPNDPIPFEHLDLASLPADAFSAAVEQHAAEVQKSLDISRGPLMRAVYYSAAAGRSGRLLLVIHHLVVDGVSWRILLQDLQQAYQQAAAGSPIQLPPKTTSFKAWAEHLARYAVSETVLEELDHWLERTSGWVAPLPIDHEGSAESNTEDSAAQVGGSLSVEETAALLTEAGTAYNTEVPDLLLTALAQTISQWTGTPTLYVHMEGHGREEIADNIDVSRTVGWFTTLYPVRLDLPWGAEPGEAILAVKEQIRQAPQHGLGYGLLRHLGGEETREALAAQPNPELAFNYLGQFDQVLTAGAEGPSVLGAAPERPGRDRAGTNPRPHLVDITAAVAGGRLGVSWTYSRALHDEATIQRLCDWHLEALQALIAHCRLPEAGAYSPSDFPLAELDQKQLDRVLKKVKSRPESAHWENS